ncbi:hypothetical protein ACLK2H_01185 [Escherichia coli]
MKASVQGEDGRNQILTMGCYGIGVTRAAAAAIEQNFDDRGICGQTPLRLSRSLSCQ